MKQANRILLVFASAMAWAPIASAKEAAKDGIDPEARAQLQRMSDFLGRKQAFLVDTQGTTDEMLPSGQLVQSSHEAKVIVRRPDGLRVDRTGDAKGATELRYDGKHLTLHSRDRGVYATVPAPPTLDAMLVSAEEELGIPTPGGDLLSSDVAGLILDGATSGEYVGKAVIDGHTTHHLAFRKKDVDVQIWVEDGAEPVPRRYVITTTSMKGHPTYTVRLYNWNTDPMVGEKDFSFQPPAGATKIPILRPKGAKQGGPQGSMLEAPDGAKIVPAYYGTSRRVARRTSRRTAYRHSGGGYYGGAAVGVVAAPTTVVQTVPSNCTTVVTNGVAAQQCGGSNYSPAYQGGNVVYVED